MRALIAGLAMTIATAASASDDDPGGTLNPDEMSLNSSLAKALRGEVNMVICSQGYLMTKKGSHKEARAIFEKCSEKGWTGTMTWMSYLEQNGFGAAEDPAAAAEWNRKAATKGDPIAKFNHGLDLLRGYGVRENRDLAKKYIDEAAKDGVQDAITLKKSGYDYHAVTPDADNWKYDKKLY